MLKSTLPVCVYERPSQTSDCQVSKWILMDALSRIYYRATWDAANIMHRFLRVIAQCPVLTTCPPLTVQSVLVYFYNTLFHVRYQCIVARVIARPRMKGGGALYSAIFSSNFGVSSLRHHGNNVGHSCCVSHWMRAHLRMNACHVPIATVFP